MKRIRHSNIVSSYLLQHVLANNLPECHVTNQFDTTNQRSCYLFKLSKACTIIIAMKSSCKGHPYGCWIEEYRLMKELRITCKDTLCASSITCDPFNHGKQNECENCVGLYSWLLVLKLGMYSCMVGVLLAFEQLQVHEAHLIQVSHRN